MAVYTHLSEQALRAYLRPFGLGEVLEARGVSAGTINTIYDVSTTRGRFILRILEDRAEADARFEEALLVHLSTGGLVVPTMLEAGRGGPRVIPIAPRQYLSVFEYLPGREVGVFEVTPSHTKQVGAFLGQMHNRNRSLRRTRRNRFDLATVRQFLKACQPAATSQEKKLDLEQLEQELARHDQTAHKLPRGLIHSDLFVDNARFDGGTLCGVLDFEMACTGAFAYDVAVALDDWAFLHDDFKTDRAAALVQGYHQVRPLRQRELDALYELCRLAAARYAVTRFHDFELHKRPDAQRVYKDYRHFMARLHALHMLGAKGFAAEVLADVVAPKSGSGKKKPSASPAADKSSP